MAYYKSFSNLIKKRPELVLAGFAVIFVAIYGWLYLSTPDIFNSPDETANFVFINHFIEEGDLNIDMGENPANLIHPRSVSIIGDHFVPGSFIGLMLLFGYFGKIFGMSIVLLLPALISVLGVLSFYGIAKRVFTQQIAFFSSLFMFFLPQWWHYSSRGLLPNVTFLSLLLIAGYAFMKAQELFKHQTVLHAYAWVMISGLVGSVAMFIRPSEFWWVAALAVAILIYFRKRISFGLLLYFAIPVILVTAIAGYWQIFTFGGLTASGYEQLAVGAGAGQSSVVSNISYLIFPFGAKVLAAFDRFWSFSWNLFWWQIILAAIGVVYLLKQPTDKKVWQFYLYVWSAISLYLIIYYGSWDIADDLDVNKISIGISYIRYWLFIYVGLLPFVILGVFDLAQIIRAKFRGIAIILLFSLLFGGSVYQVFGYGNDNLGRIGENIVKYNNTRETVMSITEDGSVIISERSDKLFWPKRRVIHFQDQDFSFVENLPEVASIYNTYWYTILPDSHVRIWEQREFLPSGMSLEFTGSIDGGKLYKIILNNNVESEV